MVGKVKLESARIERRRHFIRGQETVIAGAAIPTWIVKGRFRDGESIDDLMYDYDLSRTEIEEAIRFELKAKSRQRRELNIGRIEEIEG